MNDEIPGQHDMNRFLSLMTLILTASLAAASDDRADDVALVTLVTELGDISLEVYTSRAPRSAGSFLHYVDDGLYESAGFYRVVSPQNDRGHPVISIIQGGLLDADDEGTGVPLETTDDTGIRHEHGTISLARSAPDTGSGAAFFICIGDQPSLDFGGQRNPDGLGFAAFGKVIAGMDVVHSIHRQDAEGLSGSAYTSGQILTRPVKILKALRRTGGVDED